MDFQPEKFFTGVTDFFSILLPGAVLTYSLQDAFGPLILGASYSRLGTTQGWAAFLLSSYLLGHFIFLIGAWVFDDHVYDRIREATEREEISKLSTGGHLSSPFARRAARYFVGADADRALGQAVRIKDRHLAPLAAGAAINAFQWSKARLILDHPEAMTTVQRFEADSKFFRSLLIVLSLLLVSGLYQRNSVAVLTIPLGVLAFMRYVDQRLKATTQAYWYVITLEGEEHVTREPQPAAGRSSHAGGVVSRSVGGNNEYLLTQATHSASEWVLPKGHIEAGETAAEAAVREVREETGVWARVQRTLGVVSFMVSGQRVDVEFHLMEALEDGTPLERRKHQWLPLARAIAQVSHTESRKVLKLMETEAKSV
jgi:8-oxo-dGTP pyrophosphatase MutT (NUDIX family)